MTTFKELESAEAGTTQPLAQVLDMLPYNDQGLIAAVAQDVNTRQVLMMAWMDRTAIERTLAEGYACYYSRSRNTYWRKGETSGHLQKLVELRFDCDGDAILLVVEQTGPACHTNRDSCFYLLVDGDCIRVTEDPG
ncbi:MAG: phosphoribosyl-AMP cyclohydrolase [Gammaproteobacteria bacterium]|nr:phosphoribosyl-AMP cyclohydrolase [Gammaproteobacteria bacterium]